MWMQKNTVFSNNFVRGYNVLYFSLEMPYEACARRTMARIADVPMYALRDAALNKFQIEALRRSTDFIERYPYEFEIVDIFNGGPGIDTVKVRENLATISPLNSSKWNKIR